MAELDIGEHCNVTECHQLDFLPFTCTACNLIFCKQHRFPDTHDCQMFSAEVEDTSLGSSVARISVTCEAGECRQRELTPVRCEHCGGQFCLSHRHQQDHACRALQPQPDRMVKTAAMVQDILSRRDPPVTSQPPSSRQRRQRSSNPTADKVALMKLKMKAVGRKDIPDSEKIFFHVFAVDSSGNPLGAKKITQKALVGRGPGVAMVFSRVWTVGRVIDSIASTLDISNKNNLSSDAKLRLFSGSSGERLALDWSLKQYEEAERHLHNGCTVILTALNGDITCLDDVNYYMKSS